MSRARSIAALILVLALTLGLAGPASAATPWDQKKVTDLATDLSLSVARIRDSLNKLTPPQMGGTRQAFYQALEDIRLLKNTTRHLASRLQQGAGRDETLPIFRRVQSLRRDAAEDGRGAGTIPQDVMDIVEAARGQLDQIAPYYED